MSDLPEYTDDALRCTINEKIREYTAPRALAPSLAKIKIENLKRRVERARKAGVTCPASRHLHLIADDLLNGYHTLIRSEPEVCAESMLSVLESLWKARAELNEKTYEAQNR